MGEYGNYSGMKLFVLFFGYAIYGFVLPVYVGRIAYLAFFPDGIFDFGLYLALDTARKVAIPIFLILLVISVIFCIKQWISITKEIGHRFKK